MKTANKLLFVLVLSTVFLICFVIRWQPQRIAVRDYVMRVDEISGKREVQTCEYDSSCPSPNILFRAQTETDHLPPFACLNDISAFENSKLKRGFNVASFHGATGVLNETKFFDVSISDEKLISWLSNLPQETVIIAVSFGDFAERLSRHAKSVLAIFGAQKIQNWAPGSSYLLIGQRGIVAGQAKEMITPLGKKGQNAVFEECLGLPLSEIVNVEVNLDPVQRADEKILEKLGAQDDKPFAKNTVKLGEKWDSCGSKIPCETDQISIHVFTGEHKEDSPKMCIGDNIVFEKNLNDAGRGLNLAMVDSKTGVVEAVAHFDTYEDESKGLELWLDAIPNGFIVVAVSFDEASHQLSEMAKKILYEMGSSLIERIKFRASWYFVGHKGIGAYTPFEDMKLASGNNWAPAIKSSFCVPKALTAWNGRVSIKDKSKTDHRNLPKRHFCAKYDRHADFCKEEKLDAPLSPKSLQHGHTFNEDIFNVPILVVAGLAPDSLRKTLSSLLKQEGLNTQMVVVAYDKEYTENGDLATLFHTKGVALENNGTYNEMLIKAVSVGFSVFKNPTELIVIEEDVTVESDWLHYFSSVLSAFRKDEKLDLAMAFNPNGYEETSGSESSVYRMKDVSPMYSYMLKRDTYLRRNMKECCKMRLDWKFDDTTALVPAVSRVKVENNNFDAPKWLFSRKRVQTKHQNQLNTEFQSESEYSKYENSFKNSKRMTLGDVDCSDWKSQLTRISNVNKSPRILVEYKQGEKRKAIRCFGLSFNSWTITGNDSFRFSVNRTIEIVLTSA